MNSLNLKTLLSRIFEENGITKFWAENLSIVLLFLFTIILSILLFWVTRRIIINIFNKIATRTESTFDDLLLKNRVPRLLSYIPLLFFIYANFPGLFETIYEPFTYGLKIIIEALSVIIQVLSFKYRKKRVFLMAPFHHHFEEKGWAEPKIVVRFWIISFILVLIGLTTLKLR